MCAACVQPALKGDDGMHYGCFDNGACMYGIAIEKELHTAMRKFPAHAKAPAIAVGCLPLT